MTSNNRPVTGYRLWRYFNWSPYIVRSLHKSTVEWIPGRTLHAQCGDTSACPSMDNVEDRRLFHKDSAFECGLYAHKTDIGFPIEVSQHSGVGFYVGGWVAMWGKVEEYEKGYISQYAYPVRFSRVYFLNRDCEVALADNVHVFLDLATQRLIAGNIDAMHPERLESLHHLPSMTLMEYLTAAYLSPEQTENPSIYEAVQRIVPYINERTSEMAFTAWKTLTANPPAGLKSNSGLLSIQP